MKCARSTRLCLAALCHWAATTSVPLEPPLWPVPSIQAAHMHTPLQHAHVHYARNRDPPSGCATRLATNAARRPSAGTTCLCSDSGTIRCAIIMLLSRQYFLSDEKEFTIKESRPAYKSLLCPTRSETRVRWRCVGGCKGWLLTPCS